MNKLAVFSLVSLITTATAAAPALAQQQQQQGQTIRQNAISKSTWYTAPREIQITDDRPVVRDFREAPSVSPGVTLPNGPLGNGALPSNGLNIGSGPAYRTPSGSGPVGLPKSGFGTGSNIPASLMSPRGGLPSGVSTGTMGRSGTLPPNAHRTAPVNNAPVTARTPAPPRRPVPQGTFTYGSDYGSSASAANSQTARTGVKGTLLSRIKYGIFEFSNLTETAP